MKTEILSDEEYPIEWYEYREFSLRSNIPVVKIIVDRTIRYYSSGQFDYGFPTIDNEDVIIFPIARDIESGSEDDVLVENKYSSMDFKYQVFNILKDFFRREFNFAITEEVFIKYPYIFDKRLNLIERISPIKIFRFHNLGIYSPWTRGLSLLYQ